MQETLNQAREYNQPKPLTSKGFLRTLAVAGALVTAVCATNIYKDGVHERTWREAAHVADKHGDNNGLISPAEYSTIYKTLGLNDTGKSAFDLSTEQLRRYIKMEKLEDYGKAKEEAGLGGLF